MSLPFVTVSVCAPEVAPVSPTTRMLTPPWLAFETKCTPWLPVALMAAWYSDWALLWAGVDAAPAGEDPATAKASGLSAARPMEAAALRTKRGRMVFTLLGARRRVRRSAGSYEGRDILARLGPHGASASGGMGTQRAHTACSHGADGPERQRPRRGLRTHRLAPMGVDHVQGRGGLSLGVN